MRDYGWAGVFWAGLLVFMESDVVYLTYITGLH